MGDIITQELTLNVGPQHPSVHGLLRAIMTIDGEIVTSIYPKIGYLHRCFEKIAEKRTYAQFVPFTDRMDYLSSMLNNWGYVMAVERLADIEVPERAEYLRVIVGELNRIASHLIFYTTTGLEVGALTPFFWFFEEREKILALYERICGARLTYNYMKIGGVRGDAPPEWLEDVQKLMDYFKTVIKDYYNILLGNYICQKRLKGVGVFSSEDAIRWGLSGPALRGCGVSYDVRKDDPYSVYPKIDFEVPVGTVGDSYDRVLIRFKEIKQSINIIEQALAQIPEGPVMADGLPRTFKPAEGQSFAHVETSRGDLGFFIVSDGTTKPYRVKIQGPSFANLQGFAPMATGTYFADTIVILGTLDPVFGEVDR